MYVCVCMEVDSWDPKITTFPGLYVIAVGYSKMLNFIMQSSNVFAAGFCSLFLLRSVNIIFALASVFLILELRKMNDVSTFINVEHDL